MNSKPNCIRKGEAHEQDYKLTYFIKNTATGAYLCDNQLKRRAFRSYKEAKNEMERRGLSDVIYEAELKVR